MDEDFSLNQIYGFALSGKTGRILYRLRQIDCCYLIYPNNIDNYLEMLLRDQPSFVLGLGSYSRADQDIPRIETVCTNKFRNYYVDGNKEKRVKTNSFLSPNLQMKLATGIGNSYCNLMSWKIMHLINQKKLDSKYTFLHIPHKMKPWTVVQIIDEELLKFKQSL